MATPREVKVRVVALRLFAVVFGGLLSAEAPVFWADGIKTLDS